MPASSMMDRLSPRADDDLVLYDFLRDALPPKDLLLRETQKFVALQELSLWSENRSNPPDLKLLKTLAKLACCRVEKIETFGEEAMLLLMDALEEKFQECLKVVHEMLINGEEPLAIKVEPEETSTTDLSKDQSYLERADKDSTKTLNIWTCENCELILTSYDAFKLHSEGCSTWLDEQDEPTSLDISENVQSDDMQEIPSETSKQNVPSENGQLTTVPKKRRGRPPKIKEVPTPDPVRIRKKVKKKLASIKKEKRVKFHEKDKEAAVKRDQDDLTCRFCSEEFSDKAKLHKHIWKHNRKRSHMCDVCGKGFWMKYLLKEHRNTHTGEKPYTCSTCGISFSQMQGFNAHLRAHRFEDERKMENLPSVPIIRETRELPCTEAKDTKTSLQPSLVCRYCGRECKTLRTLSNHENIHTSGISKNSYKYFMEVKEKEFVGEKRHGCEICNEKFAYRNSLSYHKRKMHRLFICVKCGKSYNCSQALNNHLRAHAGEKNFECLICHKKYLHQTGLAKHMEVHEGKFYSCDICFRSFTRLAYLRKHQVMHGDQDKYAEVKSKRAANCRRQRSGMSEEQKEEYKKERREYMRDWLAKKRKSTFCTSALTAPMGTARTVVVQRAVSPIANTSLPVSSFLKMPIMSGTMTEGCLAINPSNAIATIIDSSSTGHDFKPLTLTIPTNMAVSLAVSNNLQGSTLNHAQLPPNVLPITLSNATLTNIPVSLSNALFVNSLATSLSTSL